jgi:DNA-binding transcriptional ArsR family regulator
VPRRLPDREAWLAALAHPDRLAVVGVLVPGPMHVTDLAAAVGVSPSAVSHHLQIMSRAGLLSVERRGKFWWYTLVGVARKTGAAVTLAHPSGLKVVVPLT